LLFRKGFKNVYIDNKRLSSKTKQQNGPEEEASSASFWPVMSNIERRVLRPPTNAEF